MVRYASERGPFRGGPKLGQKPDLGGNGGVPFSKKFRQSAKRRNRLVRARDRILREGEKLICRITERPTDRLPGGQGILSGPGSPLGEEISYSGRLEGTIIEYYPREDIERIHEKTDRRFHPQFTSVTQVEGRGRLQHDFHHSNSLKRGGL